MAYQGKRYTLAQLANHIDAELRGPADLQIAGIGSLAEASPEQISFLADKKHAAKLATSRAAAVIVTADVAGTSDRPLLVCPSPYLAYARLSQLYDRTPLPEPGIHPTAVVDAGAEVPADACIGPHCVVEKDAVLGSGVVLGPGCVVGQRSELGARTRLHANVTLYHDVSLGEDCIIHSGAVLGGDGFGFAPGGDGWVRIAQNGGVRIGSGVSIGANTTVDRGAIGDTVIEDGVIIDNLCQIAHNVQIGRNTGMAGTCGIAGSAKIGANCTLAGGAGMVGHIEIADGVHISGRTVVSKSIQQKGSSWSAGTPMMPTRDWRRAAVRFSQLEDMARRLAELEKKLAE